MFTVLGQYVVKPQVIFYNNSNRFSDSLGMLAVESYIEVHFVSVCVDDHVQ